MQEYYRYGNRPELIVDEKNRAFGDPDGNIVGWDGEVNAQNQGLSTLNRGRRVVALPTADTRGL